MVQDTDEDGVPDDRDAFPEDPSESLDTDSDGVGNNQDDDDDGDGIPDSKDGFALISLDGRTDTDGDGFPDDCDAGCLETGMTSDADDDNDGVVDSVDDFPLDALNPKTPMETSSEITRITARLMRIRIKRITILMSREMFAT